MSAPSCPASSTLPSSGRSKPAIIRRHVVFPEPDGPSSVKNSSSRMSRSTRSTATTSPYVFRAPSRRTATSPFWVTRPLVHRGAPFVRVVRVNLLLAVAVTALVMATPANASAPISAHAMVHTCCTPKAEKERIFSEAAALGAAYVRVDVELSGVFKEPDPDPDWSGLDEVIELSKKHRVRVLGILLPPHDYTDAEEFGPRSGAIAEHAGGAIDHWEVLNEPDGKWAWGGTPEEYARMLSAAHDAIKAKEPGDRIVLGGLMKPHEPGWLQRGLDTPSADAIHKFDIANIHMRGPLDAVVHRFEEFRDRLAS